MFKKTLTGIVLLALILLSATIAIRTTILAPFPDQQTADPVTGSPSLDHDTAVKRLSQALRYPTISPDSPEHWQSGPFIAFREFLSEAWPNVHNRLETEIIGGHSLLFKWRGSDPELKPLLLMAHYDVVPVDADSGENWTYPPFAGTVADGYIWGRGALDNKSGVTGILEAVELLIREGFEPRRTLLLAFGHDEEIGGQHGAREIARVLKSRDIRLAAVVDEGGLIVPDNPLTNAPVALVGTAEKGYVSLNLSVAGTGGHSSQPPKLTAAGRLARAIDRVQSSPFPARLKSPTRDMLEHMTADMALPYRVLIANQWLFSPLILRALADDPATRAMTRTTIAPTMLRGSDKDNVLPVRAEGVINFRLLPGDTVDSVKRHVRRAIDDPKVSVSQAQGFGTDPSPLSPVDTPVFTALANTIRQIHPGTVVAPYLVVGATDSRHFQGLSGHIYRFIPFEVPAADLGGIHGTDERLGVDAYINGIRFYRQLIVNMNHPDSLQ